MSSSNPAQAATPIAELGVLEENRTFDRCFGCHSTAFVNPASMEPGVRCQRCHGPGVSHGAAKTKKNIVNSGRFTQLAQVLKANMLGQDGVRLDALSCQFVDHICQVRSPQSVAKHPGRVRLAPLSLVVWVRIDEV